MPSIISYYLQFDLFIEGRVPVKFSGCLPPLPGTHKLIVGTAFTSSVLRDYLKLDTGKDR